MTNAKDRKQRTIPMSKLIELIRKLGQQSQQPLGFGALSAASEPSPTMILIGRTSASAVSDELKAVEGDVVDAVMLDAEGAVSDADSDALEGLVWGVGPGPLSDADVETLVSAGCDFFVIDPDTAPAAVASQPDAATIVTLSEPADRETSQALRALGVDGSLSAPPAGLKEIAYRDLLAIQRMGMSTGGAMLVQPPDEISESGLAALRDAGVDGVAVSLSDAARVSDLAGKIRALPPRKRSQAQETRFQALAPSGD